MFKCLLLRAADYRAVPARLAEPAAIDYTQKLMVYLAGIDGGGSKTDCWLADAQGGVLGRGRSEASSLTHVNGELAYRHLETALRAAFAAARLAYRPAEIAAVCGGFAGAGRANTNAAYGELLARLFPRARQRVATDVRVGFEGALGGHAGIIVIAGTGSIAYGRDAGGREARAGGYGPELSDEGGGYVLGREAVRRVLHAWDRRAAPTRLREGILNHWQVNGEAELLDELLARRRAGESIPYAQLLPSIQAAAAAGDSAAKELIEQAGRQLAVLAAAVAQQLHIADPLVAYAGGLLRNLESLRMVWQQAVRLRLPGARILAAQDTPPAGALRLAQELLAS